MQRKRRSPAAKSAGDSHLITDDPVMQQRLADAYAALKPGDQEAYANYRRVRAEALGTHNNFIKGQDQPNPKARRHG